MLEGLWFASASRAGYVGALVEPGGVGGQVALCRSHLVDPTCHELPQAHEGLWGEGGGVLVVWGSGRIGGLVLEEHVPSAGPEGLVGLFHELGGRDVYSWRIGGM